MDSRDFLANLWRWKCGLPEEDFTTIKVTLEQRAKSEWSPKFESLMRNRLILGSFRYGFLSSKDKSTYDRVGSAIKRLNRYQETGNQEYLVDAANMCLVEFVEGSHPKAHFESIDDDDVHAEKI